MVAARRSGRRHTLVDTAVHRNGVSADGAVLRFDGAPPPRSRGGDGGGGARGVGALTGPPRGDAGTVPRVQLQGPRRTRWAWIGVAVAFVVNGMTFGSILPRLPEIKATLDLTAGELGLSLLGSGLGGLVGSLAAGPLVRRHGSASTTQSAGVLLQLAPLLVVLAPSGGVLLAALAVMGVLDATHDVAMNAAALRLQATSPRSAFTRLHGLWSVGALSGAAIGTACAAAGIPLLTQVVVVGLVAGVAHLTTTRGLPADRRAVDVDRGQGAAPDLRALRRGWVVLVAAALFVPLVESAAMDWSAIFLREGLGTGPGTAGLATTLFSAGMLAGRLVGDRVIDTLGHAATARWAGLWVAVTAGALLPVAATGSVVAALVLFPLVGVGAAPLYPLMFTAGERLGGSATGTSLVSAVGRLGFLVAPLTIGTTAEVTSLAFALGLIPLAGAVCAVILPLTLAPGPPRPVDTPA